MITAKYARDKAEFYIVSKEINNIKYNFADVQLNDTLETLSRQIKKIALAGDYSGEIFHNRPQRTSTQEEADFLNSLIEKRYSLLCHLLESFGYKAKVISKSERGRNIPFTSCFSINVDFGG